MAMGAIHRAIIPWCWLVCRRSWWCFSLGNGKCACSYNGQHVTRKHARVNACAKREKHESEVMKVWASIREVVRRFRVWRKRRWMQRQERRARQFPRAFPSDTYVADLDRAAKTKKMWTKWLFAIVVGSAFVDFYLLQDAFAWMLGTASFSDLLKGNDAGLIAVFTALTCFALVVLYLTFGDIAGKKIAEFKAFRGRGSLAACIALLIVMFVVLVFIAFVRYCSILDGLTSSSSAGEMFKGGFGGDTSGGGFGGFGGSVGAANDALSIDLQFSSEALTQTLGLLAVMFLGALLEVAHAYYSMDPYAAEKKRLAESYIPEDRCLYESTYASCAIEPIKNMEREERERILDKQTVDAAFRICELSTQLNGIVDPADAYDFCNISRIVRERRVENRAQGEFND